MIYQMYFEAELEMKEDKKNSDVDNSEGSEEGEEDHQIFLARSYPGYSWPVMVMEKHIPNYPNLCLANKQLRIEATYLMLRKATSITFQGEYVIRRFLEFLEPVPKEYGYHCIRHLEFPNMHQFKGHQSGEGGMPLDHAAVQLMMRCPNLEHIGMSFLAKPLTVPRSETSYPHWQRHRVPRSLDAVLDFYQLRPLLECNELERVDLDGNEAGVNKYMVNRPAEKPLDTLWELGHWIKDGFEAKGKSIDVRVRSRNESRVNPKFIPRRLSFSNVASL